MEKSLYHESEILHSSSATGEADRFMTTLGKWELETGAVHIPVSLQNNIINDNKQVTT